MSSPTGRREANKLATRTALRHAAARLFAQQGYDATTIAQIARAAEVGERTFYRYFDGKDDLLAEQTLAWMNVLHEAICSRPADEGPYLAVARAMTAEVARLAADTEGGGAWLLTELPRPVAVLRRATPAPLRRLERSIADAILYRLNAGADAPDLTPGQARARRQVEAPGPAAAQFQAQLLARAAVATLRTAVSHHRELVRGGTASPGPGRLLDDAFEQLAELTKL